MPCTLCGMQLPCPGTVFLQASQPAVVRQACGCKECAGPTAPLWGGFRDIKKRERERETEKDNKTLSPLLLMSQCSSVARQAQVLEYCTKACSEQGEGSWGDFIFSFIVSKSLQQSSTFPLAPSPPNPPLLPERHHLGEKSKEHIAVQLCCGYSTLTRNKGMSGKVEPSGYGCSVQETKEKAEHHREGLGGEYDLGHSS